MAAPTGGTPRLLLEGGKFLSPKTFRKGGGEYFDAASFNPGMKITLRFAAGQIHSLILLGRFNLPNLTPFLIICRSLCIRQAGEGHESRSPAIVYSDAFTSHLLNVKT